MYLDFNHIGKQNAFAAYDAATLDITEKTDIPQIKQDESGNAPSKELVNANPNTVKALEAAGITVNEETAAMVELMMREGLKIDKESLQSMYRLLLKNPGVPTEQLLKMNALQIEINDVNIRQFAQYENMTHQLTEGFADLSNQAMELGRNLFESGNVQEAVSFLKQMVAALGDAATNGMPKELVDMQKLFDTKGQLIDMMKELSESTGITRETGKAYMNELLMMVKNLVGAESESKLPEIPFPEAYLQNQTDGLAGQIADSVNQGADAFSQSPDFAQVTQDIKNQNAQTIIDMAGQGEATEKGAIVSQKMADVVKGQTEEALNPEAKTGVELFADGKNAELTRLMQEFDVSLIKYDPKSAETNLKEAVRQFASQVNEMLQHAFTDKESEFAKTIKMKMMDNLLLKPEEVADAKKMNEYFDKLAAKMEHLTKVFDEAGLGQSQIAKSAGQVRENVQFMNQLNQVFQYVQLPLKMQGKNANGDLYVYSNKKNFTDADGNMSALLHLDMEHIGPLDVYVQMSKGDHVSTDFYLQDEETIDFIEKHIHLLNERLNQKGYVAQSTVSLQKNTKEKSVIAHMMEKKSMSLRTKLLSTNSFDMLA